MKSRLLKYIFITAVVSLFAGTGCTTPKMSDSRVDIAYPLGNYVHLVTVESFEGMDDTLTVQLTLRNHSNALVGMLYKVDWYTREGMVYDTILSKWKQRQAYDRETFIIKEVAPSPDIVDFRVQLRKE